MKERLVTLTYSEPTAVIKVKHLMDALEEDDGVRIWVEPIGLTRDLAEWCSIDNVIPQMTPSQKTIFVATHAEGFDYYVQRFHEELRKSPQAPTLKALAMASRVENFTLIHASEDPAQNCAMALFEYLAELAAECTWDEEA